jgi:hypothetical protein
MISNNLWNISLASSMKCIELLISVLAVFIPTLYLHIIFSHVNLISYIIIATVFLLLKMPRAIIYFALVSTFDIYIKHILISYVGLYFESVSVFHQIISTVFNSLVFLSIFCSNINIRRFAIYIFVLALTFFCFGKYFQFEPILRIVTIALLCCFAIFTFDEIKFRNNQLSCLPTLISLTILAPLLYFATNLSNQEVKTIGILDTKWCSTKGDFSDDYSMKSAYSYSVMRKILENKYKIVDIYNHSGINLELNNIDLLFILTPTYIFSDKDTEIIASFVKNGGKVVGISDHTDLYGHARNLNKLLKIFNVRVNYDSVFSPVSEKVSVHFSHLDFQQMDVKTPCTISIFNFADVWGIARDSIRENADYSRANFFGELKWTADDQLSDWVVGITRPYGLGEVSLFSDSTIFSNFAIFQPGNIDLLSSLLNHNGFSIRIFQVSILLFILSYFIFLQRKNHVYFLYCASFCITMLIISMQNKFDNRLLYNDNFINVYSDISVISEPASKHINYTSHLSTLYANIARSGFFPKYSGHIIPEIINAPSLAFINADNIDTLSKIKSGHDKLKVVFYGDSKTLLKYTSINNYDMNIERSIQDYFNIENEKSFSYVNADKHNFFTHGVNSVAAHGLLDDQTLNTWWVNKDISPFKRFMLDSFYSWILHNNDIGIFDYPSIGFDSCTKGSDCLNWKFKISNHNNLSINATIASKNGFVYLGARRWAFLENMNNTYFLLGSPEICDFYNKNSYFNDSWGSISDHTLR